MSTEVNKKISIKLLAFSKLSIVIITESEFFTVSSKFPYSITLMVSRF